jgi:hypothetical protein
MARGWLKQEKRKNGRTWVLRFKTTRKTDSKRIEHKIAVGLVRDFPSESSAWMEVERQLNVNKPNFRGAVKFSDLGEHDIEHELGDQSASTVRAERERRSTRGSRRNARCNGCSTGDDELKTGLATGKRESWQTA